MSIFASAPSVTILIPAYNEEAGLGKTLAALRKELRLSGAEVIVIDDGSTDRTAEIAADHGAAVIRNWTNLGYGASLKRGVRAAAGEVVAWFDADGQHAPSDLADMIDRLRRDRAHAVIGARTAESHVVKRRVIGKRILKAAAEAAAGRPIPDFNCGLRVFRRTILERYLEMLPDGFSASTTTTLLFLKRNYHVVFHPVHVAERIGKSTVRQVRDGLRTLHTILRLAMMFNAFRTFSAFAALLVGGGVLYGLPLSLVRGEGFPVLAALAIILGVQVFCLGVVCDQISALRLERLGPSQLDVEAEEEPVSFATKRAA
jgi:glycosyltransferase involved in cell wall biosynthesis